MAHPWYHSLSHAKRFGGVADDYRELNNFLDQVKEFNADCRHRLVLHNAWGIFIAERRFGMLYTRISDGVQLPTRTLAEKHIFEDLGAIPSVAQCLAQLPPEEADVDEVGVLAAHYARTLFPPDLLPVTLSVAALTVGLLFSTRAHLADCRHRRLLFNSWGITLVAALAAPRDPLAAGRSYAIAHQLVSDIYDGAVPTVDESLAGIEFQPWMCRGAQRLSQSLGTSVATERPTFVTKGE